MSAFSRSDFVGMQPRWRHVPPRNGSFSMTATFMPSCPARIPATYPPGPLPMTTTSYCCSDKENLPCFVRRALYAGHETPGLPALSEIKRFRCDDQHQWSGDSLNVVPRESFRR